MNPEPASRWLAHPVPMRCIDGRGNSVDLTVRFEYNAADPFAVWVCFPRGIRWAMSRELLSRGMSDPAGDGDVHVEPGVDEAGQGVVLLEFRSPDGHLRAQAATRELYRFLTRTMAVVPFGTEKVDIDAILGELLATE